MRAHQAIGWTCGVLSFALAAVWAFATVLGPLWLVSGPECSEGGSCEELEWALLTVAATLCAAGGAFLAAAAGRALLRYARGGEGRWWMPLFFAGAVLLMPLWFVLIVYAAAVTGSFR